jgi:Fatty acid cis/trans isomerase (CTI)
MKKKITELFRKRIHLPLLLSMVAVLPAATALSAPAPNAPQRAQAILEQRCMVCHGCYDAPCQLKLEAQAGLERGASKEVVYDGTRLLSAAMTRLFDDAQTTQEWRDKGFYSVTNAANPADGVMYRMLALKQAHPLPASGPLPSEFDFSLYRDQQCAREDEFDSYAKEFPFSGMPYGFPGLDTKEHQVLTDWLAGGAKVQPLQPLAAATELLLGDWEAFLNGQSKREKLVSRYLYEHLFLATLHLEVNNKPVWFRLVRSSTPPGQPLELIATRRPYDAPPPGPLYYRLQRMDVTPLAKIHMPYRFDRARLARYRELFIDADYQVEALPGYGPDIASNPFRVFEDIPVDSRYRFLLDEAQFSIMNFIKGPVCRGQIALNVIDDRFWVMFVSPDELDAANTAEFLSREASNLRLPNPKTGTAIDILSWRRYAKSHERYQRARSRAIRSMLNQNRTADYDAIWDGGGNNDNAALTIFRHFDTASVVKGFVGEVPKTAWVIDYSLLERIHYLLVAGFDVYGSVSHQLESRLYMDFLRMEGEFNFLMFMPAEQRLAMHDYWYRDAGTGSRDHFLSRSSMGQETSGIKFDTDSPKEEFLTTVRARIYGAQAANYDYRSSASPAMLQSFRALAENQGAHNSFLPQTSFINVVGPQRDEVYSLIRNNGYSNIAQLFKEEERRLPEEDTLTVVRGFLGAYPNYFFLINESQLAGFVEAIAKLQTPADFQALKQHYGVQRNEPFFWRLSDKLHGMYRLQNDLEWGIFDYNRYLGD